MLNIKSPRTGLTAAILAAAYDSANFNFPAGLSSLVVASLLISSTIFLEIFS